MAEGERASRSGEPVADRPRMPAGYGVPGTDAGLLPWSWAAERLARARHYWLATAAADGSPHAVPVWGVWVGGRLYFGGHPRTRTLRNVAAYPRVAAHIEDGGDVVIVEGVAERVADRALLATLSAAGAAKYLGGARDAGGDPHGETADAAAARGSGADDGEHVTYVLRPVVAFGWGDRFPEDATRWRFGDD